MSHAFAKALSRRATTLACLTVIRPSATARRTPRSASTSVNADVIKRDARRRDVCSVRSPSSMIRRMALVSTYNVLAALCSETGTFVADLTEDFFAIVDELFLVATVFVDQRLCSSPRKSESGPVDPRAILRGDSGPNRPLRNQSLIAHFGWLRCCVTSWRTQLGDDPPPIGYQDMLPLFNAPEVAAQVGFEVSNASGYHTR